MDTGSTNLIWARELVDALVAAGVRHACVSPGSRSSPLALAVAHAEADGLTSSVHIDERAAGYFAVGYGRATGHPAMLICTSGTAAANYLPAVVEAHHSCVPLVVVTADRPPELRDSGSWQTIDQVRIYGGKVRWSVNVVVPANEEDLLNYVRDVGTRAAAIALGGRPGPVHLNVPFREPLLPETGAVPEATESGVPFEAHGSVPPTTAALQADHADRLAGRLAATPRGLILAGQIYPQPGYAAAVARLARATGYPVLAEPLGGLRFGEHDQSNIVAHYEALLRSPRWFSEHAPAVVIRFGASFVWRHVTERLVAHKPARRIIVDPNLTWDDPTRLPSTRLAVAPALLCQALAERVEALAGAQSSDEVPETDWLQQWRDADDKAAGVLRECLADSGSHTSTPWIHRTVLDNVRHGSLVYAANSMAVRDLDSFTSTMSKAVRVIANRGAAGIDGTMSSALGAAFGSGRPTVLVTGDLAFAHDLGGLSAADLDGLDVTIVVLNDGGGGIFEHLPTAALSEEVFERYFVTPTGLEIATACCAYSVPHSLVTDSLSLAAVIEDGSGVRVAEVLIDRGANTAWHRRYWDAVDRAITS